MLMIQLKRFVNITPKHINVRSVTLERRIVSGVLYVVSALLFSYNYYTQASSPSLFHGALTAALLALALNRRRRIVSVVMCVVSALLFLSTYYTQTSLLGLFHGPLLAALVVFAAAHFMYKD